VSLVRPLARSLARPLPHSLIKGGGWLPSVLFAQGAGGAWYDPSDLTTLFQDSSGTIPVTADGDPVGKVLDKSGNENHLTQSTDLQRPTYKTAGGLHWFAFDGSADRLLGSAITGSVISAGAAAHSSGVSGTPVLMSNIISASDRTVMSLDTTEAIFGYYNGTAYSRVSGAASAVPNVLTGELNKGTSVGLRLNGVAQAGTTSPSSSSTAGLSVGATTTGADLFTGKLFSLVVLASAFSGSGRSDLERYLARISGAAIA